MAGVSLQLWEHGIRVNYVSPNGLTTPSMCKRIGMSVEEIPKIYGQCARLKGVALTSEHVANALLFLASDDSVFVTRHDLAVNGGFT